MKVIMRVEIYENTINPFDKETAVRFVWHHRNVCDVKTIRRVVFASDNLIVVKEIGYFEGEKRVWYWGFGRQSRGIIVDADGLKTREAVEIFLDKL